MRFIEYFWIHAIRCTNIIYICSKKGETESVSVLLSCNKKRPLSLSDLFRDPDSIIEDFNDISDDDDIEYVNEYGIGVDCHSKFIEVCVRYHNTLNL